MSKSKQNRELVSLTSDEEYDNKSDRSGKEHVEDDTMSVTHSVDENDDFGGDSDFDEPPKKRVSKKSPSKKKYSSKKSGRINKPDECDITIVKKIGEIYKIHIKGIRDAFASAIRETDINTENVELCIKKLDEVCDDHFKSTYGISKEKLNSLQSKKKTSKKVKKLDENDIIERGVEQLPLNDDNEIITVVKGTDTKHGKYIKYHNSEAKVVKLERYYKNGKVDGVVSKFNSSGDLMETTEYVNGKRHGVNMIYAAPDKKNDKASKNLSAKDKLISRLKCKIIWINSAFKRIHTRNKTKWETMIYDGITKSRQEYDERKSSTLEEVLEDKIQEDEQIDIEEIGKPKKNKKDTKPKTKRTKKQTYDTDTESEDDVKQKNKRKVVKKKSKTPDFSEDDEAGAVSDDSDEEKTKKPVTDKDIDDLIDG